MHNTYLITLAATYCAADVFTYEHTAAHAQQFLQAVEALLRNKDDNAVYTGCGHSVYNGQLKLHFVTGGLGTYKVLLKDLGHRNIVLLGTRNDKAVTKIEAMLQFLQLKQQLSDFVTKNKK
jgi:hypothetical protein